MSRTRSAACFPARRWLGQPSRSSNCCCPTLISRDCRWALSRIGSSYFHMFEARMEKRFSHGVQFLANYSWSKTLDRTSRLNDTDPYLEKRISPDDRPQRVVASAMWELPFGKGKAVNTAVPV